MKVHSYTLSFVYNLFITANILVMEGYGTGRGCMYCVMCVHVPVHMCVFAQHSKSHFGLGGGKEFM